MQINISIKLCKHFETNQYKHETKIHLITSLNFSICREIFYTYEKCCAPNNIFIKTIAMMTTNNYYQLLSDRELLDLVKANDNNAFGEIYNRYWDFLIQSASRHLQSKQKAEDLVQEIFLSFYNRRNEFELAVSLRAYLSQALKFKIMNEYRSQVVRDTYQKNVHYTYTYAYAGNNVHHAYETKELAYNINRSINMLPEKCKQAFLLSRSEDLSYKDISGHLNISVSTVEKHIIKALKFLKTNLCLQ